MKNSRFATKQVPQQAAREGEGELQSPASDAKWYSWNEESGEHQQQRLQQSDTAAASAAGEMPGGAVGTESSSASPPWVQYWDESACASYYYNTETGEATWVLPAEGVS